MPASKKKALRLLMKERRAVLFHQHPKAGEMIAHLFFDNFDFPTSSIIGGYWPIGSEVDLRPLLMQLIQRGFKCALPCVDSKGLIFRLWNPSHPLVQGGFQLLEPLSTEPIVFPDILLLPLLAFDKKRHRLGYGQGHFDRYLHHHKVLTIGVGFKGQGVEELPVQAHDFALDFILTEEGVLS
jgi:5-formyltetrahydrofolate cyclo-ligase